MQLSREEICHQLELRSELIYLGNCQDDVITAGLRADAEDVARELHETYGDAVQLSVGLFPYPPPAETERACRHIRDTSPVHPPLRATMKVDRTVPAGAFYQGEVTITNLGVEPFNLETSSNFELYLFRADDAEPIGLGEGGQMGTGYGQTLRAGEAVTLPAGGGTASCDLRLGYTLPPGSYAARSIIDYQAGGNGATFFWSEPAPVDIVAG